MNERRRVTFHQKQTKKETTPMNKQHVGAKLKKLREARGWSYDQAMVEVNVAFRNTPSMILNRSAIVRAEQNPNPSWQTVFVLATVYDTTVDAISPDAKIELETVKDVLNTSSAWKSDQLAVA